MAEDDDDELEGGQTEGADGEEGESEEGGGGGKKKLLIIVGGALLLLIGVGAGLYFTGMLDGLLGKSAEQHCEVDEHGEEHCEPVEHEKEASGDHGGGHGEEGGGGRFVEIPTIIVNLNSEDDVPRYLRLTVQLELENPGDKAAIEAVTPRVVDQFQTYLRELRVKDLRGSAGIYRLQMELLWRVNQAAAPVEIKDVLFQEILIQ